MRGDQKPDILHPRQHIESSGTEDKPLNKLPCLLFIIPFLLLVMLAVLYSIPAASVKIIFVLLAMSFKLDMIPIALFEMFKAFAAISTKVP